MAARTAAQDRVQAVSSQAGRETQYTHFASSEIYRGSVNAWNSQQRERSRLLRSAGPDGQVNVDSLSAHPASYGHWDITEDSSHWSNRC